jgi:hypothetical protein
MADIFSQLLNKKPYEGLYPGADPYNKAQMVREKIPSAQQEALQAPTVDPVMATVLGGAGLVSNPAMIVHPGGIAEKGGDLALKGLFGYLVRQTLDKTINKIRNTSIDLYKDEDSRSARKRHFQDSE